jgi:DNA polymerase-3 subunit delta'
MTARWVRETKRKSVPAEQRKPEHAPLRPPIGQGVAYNSLLRRARNLQLPHALVLSGAPGTGKTTALRWLTAALLCPSELDPDAPCGLCSSCKQVESDQHADVQVLELARDEDDKKEFKHLKKSFYVLSVEQVRHAQEALARTSFAGRARVLRIDNADCLSEEAQNALLKTLEEPPPATFLLLEAGAPERLLSTVRSRVQGVAVQPLSDQRLQQEFLRRVEHAAERLPQLLPLVRGSLGRALDLIEPQMVRLHDLVVEALQDRKGLRVVAVAQAVVAGQKERRLQIEMVRSFLWILRAELRARRDALAKAPVDAYPPDLTEPWCSWLEATLAAERDLDLQIAPVQALAACLLRLVSE